MIKKYALIYPAFTYSYDGFADLPAMIVEPLHHFSFQKICGYSLGNQAKFFDTLEEAKASISGLQPKIAKQNAVIEFDIEESNVVAVSTLYQLKELSLIKQSEKHPGFFEPATKMEWEDRPVLKEELSEAALDELNDQYHRSSHGVLNATSSI